MDKIKYCKSCKLDKNLKEFLKIIRREDFGLNSDEDGYSHLLKELKQCISCREKCIYYKNLQHKK